MRSSQRLSIKKYSSPQLRLALQTKQCFVLAQVVAKIITDFIMKFKNGTTILCISFLVCSILAYNASHL
jgi:hypothetical protein